MALNHKQQRFVAEYLVDFNATQAAIRAGYSAKTAYSQGQRLLKHVEIATAIEQAGKQVAERVGLTQQDVLDALARVALFDPRRLYGSDGELLHPKDWPDDVALAMGGFDVTSTISEDGVTTRVSKVKPNDRLRAVELIGRYFAMFTDKMAIEGIDEMADRMERARRRLEAGEDGA